MILSVSSPLLTRYVFLTESYRRVLPQNWHSKCAVWEKNMLNVVNRLLQGYTGFKHFSVIFMRAYPRPSSCHFCNLQWYCSVIIKSNSGRSCHFWERAGCMSPGWRTFQKRSTALLGMGMKVLPRRATQYLAKFHFAWHMFLLLGCRLSLRCCWVKFRSVVWILDSALCFGWWNYVLEGRTLLRPQTPLNR